MPRDYVYYRDWNDRHTGWRWRLVITPPHNTALSIGSVPAFGLNTYSGKFIPFPADIIFRPPDNESAGYNDRPLGAMQLPSMKLAFNLANIKGEVDTNSDGTTDMEDLLGYIVEQKWNNGGTIEGRGFATSTLFTLYTDRGDSSITDVTLFDPYFVGAQRIRPTTKFVINWRNETARIELELIHLVRIACENVIPDDVATRVQNGTHPVGPKQFYLTYELLWKQTSPQLAWFGHLRAGPFDGRQQQVDMWRLVDFYRTLSTCIEDVMRAFTRTTASFIFDGSRGVTINGRRTATPVDVFRLYRQRINDASGEKGTELATTDLWIVGRVSYLSTGQAIGGFLRDDATGEGQESLWRWSNMWDFLIASTGVAMMRVEAGSATAFTIFWDYISPVSAQISIDRSIVLGNEVTIEQGAATIRGASAEPAEEAQDPIEYKIKGLDAEADATIQLVFSNHPDWADSNETFAPLIGTIDGTAAAFATLPGFRSFGLYYIDTVGSAEAPIRPHHYCEVNNGVGWRTGDCADAVPPPGGILISSFGGGPVYPGMEKSLWAPIRGMFHQMIYQASMPYASAKAVTFEFSNPMQNTTEMEVPLAIVCWKDIGRRVSSTWSSGTEFLWDSMTFLDPIPGAPVIVSAQDNPGTAMTKLLLLAQGT